MLVCARRGTALEMKIMKITGNAAAFEVLTKGGNAFDAGAAAMLVGGVVEQDLYSLGGEGLVLVYPQSTKKVVAVVGQGWAPKAATIDYFTSRHKNLNGAGLDPAVVPGADLNP